MGVKIYLLTMIVTALITLITIQLGIVFAGKSEALKRKVRKQYIACLVLIVAEYIIGVFLLKT